MNTLKGPKTVLPDPARRMFLRALFPLLTALFLFSCAGAPTASPPESSPVEAENPAAGPGRPEAPLTTGDILARIARLLDSGDYEEALALFETLDAEEAASTELRLLKASIWVAAGYFPEARALLGELLREDPASTPALFILAKLEASMGKTKEQKAVLDRIVKIDPEHADALASLGNLSAYAKSYRNAASYFDRALKSDPTQPDALLGRAVLFKRERNREKAREYLDRAIEVYPSWFAPYVERARLSRVEGLFEEALADLDTANALDGGDYWAAVDRGNVLLDLRRLPEALGDFERAIAINPRHYLAYVYSAGIKDDLGDYDGAEKDYTVLVKLKPDYYFGLEGLGVIKIRKSAWADAAAVFRAAYTYAPDTMGYAFLAAGNFLRAGKREEAKSFLAEVLRKAPRDSVEWRLFRLYHDLSGDTDVVSRVDRENNPDKKARLLYYLADYYAIKGNNSLADKLYLAVRDLDRQGTLEWKLNDIALETRNLKEKQ